MPLRLVVIQYPFEIGNIHPAAIITHNIKITVVRMINRRRIIDKERNPVLCLYLPYTRQAAKTPDTEDIVSSSSIFNFVY